MQCLFPGGITEAARQHVPPTSTASTTSDRDCSEYEPESDTDFIDISGRINEESGVDSNGESESERGDKRYDKVEPYRDEPGASGNSSIF